jgi:hypothetical protein
VLVRATPERAFSLFTGRMGRWWPRTHTTNTAPIADVIIEPRAGGRWFERGIDGSERDWGHVIAWEPPGRILLGWQLSPQWRFDPTLITEVELRFIPEGALTRVELEHRHLERYGEAAAKMRDTVSSPNGWPGILQGYASFDGAA